MKCYLLDIKYILILVSISCVVPTTLLPTRFNYCHILSTLNEEIPFGNRKYLDASECQERRVSGCVELASSTPRGGGTPGGGRCSDKIASQKYCSKLRTTSILYCIGTQSKHSG